ncbi:hypothetical protein F0562_036210 [Nyssa sinensis]|uniref:Uncharacterized protein n=1 Tax=Nyssa sinensis TaxID=561372 RepID=A0A5J5ACX1_9ASTE|nr:hypothetical protein F0562_036210 [Nyssa sinensis]
MELWNNNDVYQKEYVRCNKRSMLRRLRTLDGRSLGPDELPPLLPNFVNERVDRTEHSGGENQKACENCSATVSGRDETEEMEEEEYKQTKEELELARKAEELGKEEAAARLKEQRRLEEKAKAQKALERKKRNAEKAQIRAKLQVQKEKEKRARKKERDNGDGCRAAEALMVTMKEKLLQPQKPQLRQWRSLKSQTDL